MKTEFEVLNVEKIRRDFPILNQTVNGKPLVYLDSSATSQKPLCVIDVINNYYKTYNANVHRAAHRLATEATEAYEESRRKIANFIGAEQQEIIFVKNTTEAINLVFYSWALENLKAGDVVVTTIMEHHSNIVPWQQLQSKGVKLGIIDILTDGTLDLEQLKAVMSDKVKLIAVTHCSNVLGTINPVKEIAQLAHKYGALVLVDGAQSVPHMPIDVKDLDCDFFVFSGHKMLGPTGIGCLYGKEEILKKMKPFMFGGDMIKEVHLRETTFADLPNKFEAGTPDIAGAIGLGAAVDYLQNIGMKNIYAHEKELVRYAIERLSQVKDLKIVGPTDSNKRGGLVAFTLGDIHGHDLSQILDAEGIAVRAGHHCAMPLHERLGLASSTRASFYFYNTKEEVDKLVEALEKARTIFKL